MSQQNDGSDEHQHASNECDSPTTPSIPDTGVVSNRPPSLNENENTRSKDRDCLEHKRFVVERITLGVLVIYAATTFFMYCANKKAADAATSAANTATRSLQLDQRAWVGPNEIVRPQFVVDGKPKFVKVGEKTTLGVFIINSGKSPALAVRSKTNIKAMKGSDTFFADYPPAQTKVVDSTYVLQPAMRMEVDSLPTGVPIQLQHITGFQDGTWVLYFYGEITYDDIFKQFRHTTHFCLALSRDLAQLQACPSYNDAD